MKILRLQPRPTESDAGRGVGHQPVLRSPRGSDAWEDLRTSSSGPSPVGRNSGLGGRERWQEGQSHLHCVILAEPPSSLSDLRPLSFLQQVPTEQLLRVRHGSGLWGSRGRKTEIPDPTKLAFWLTSETRQMVWESQSPLAPSWVSLCTLAP